MTICESALVMYAQTPMGESSSENFQGGANRADLALRDEPAPQEALQGELLTTAEVAKMAGVSRATVTRARRDGLLAGVPTGNGFAYRKTEVVEFGQVRSKVLSVVDKEKHAGERDAAIVERLEAGDTVAQAVMATRAPIDVVVRIRQVWADSKRGDAALATHACACGAASDPRTARCMPCHIRSRVLTSEQITRLAQKD